jgi:lipopolysaccharide/colanic/teichoic acid biosynthesis glycosyltransferase
MTKRLLDISLATLLTLISLPPLVVAMMAIYFGDRHWPLYSPYRIGIGGRSFRMHKLRSMVVDADKSKMDTTAANDCRITPVGRLLRRLKLDEVPQLWNVVMGEMSLVGPRPQIDREVALYTEPEKKLLSVKPGITDFSSIVFADLGEIMAAHSDPNIAYNQLVRPWKSRLGLFYVDHAGAGLDLALIGLTALNMFHRDLALRGMASLLRRLRAPEELVQMSLRRQPLIPTPPPGSDQIVTSRTG